jgi:cytochrome c biogenesis protein CcmG, thiol:disulfide interchange protein DsbE
MAAVLLVVLLLVGAGYWLLHDPPVAGQGPPRSPGGESAPPLAGPTLAGGTLDLADLRGDVVVVNVWAAWCAPCREELPVLVSFESAHAGLRVVGIDTRDGERQARELLARVGGDPRSAVMDPAGRLATAWGVAGVPETFVLDAVGTVRSHRLGPVSEGWLADHVVPLLEDG